MMVNKKQAILAMFLTTMVALVPLADSLVWMWRRSSLALLLLSIAAAIPRSAAIYMIALR
jgi:hypothetical protein